MKPSGARRRIVAYVEGYDDVMFWRNVLTRFENDKRAALRSNAAVAHIVGKRQESGHNKHTWQYAGEDKMIACVDADYDYLLQGARETSRTICQNPYVFHTYAYAIENFQCYAPLLRGVCVAATLNDRKVFDFERYMHEFSELVYPVFVWNVWRYRTGNYKHFSLTSLCAVIALRDINLYHPERGLATAQAACEPHHVVAAKTFPASKKGIQAVKR